MEILGRTLGPVDSANSERFALEIVAAVVVVVLRDSVWSGTAWASVAWKSDCSFLKAAPSVLIDSRDETAKGSGSYKGC